MDMVTLPTEVDVELVRQVAGQFIRGGLGCLARHGMAGTHVDVGHEVDPLVKGQDSLSGRFCPHQSHGGAPGPAGRG
jgi:hypothetical protein